METMTARCGLICSECEAFKATKKNDPAELAVLVKKWGEMFQKDITVKDVLCDGCLSTSGRLCAYCYQCGIKKCAEDKGLENCAYCGDYGCETLSGFFTMAPKAKENLEAIRAKIPQRK